MGIPDAAKRPAPHRARIRLDLYRCLPKELISSSVAKEYCGSDDEKDILAEGYTLTLWIEGNLDIEGMMIKAGSCVGIKNG